MPASLKDNLIVMHKKNNKPTSIFRVLVRALINDANIFRTNADTIKIKYPIVNACKGIFIF